MTASSPEHLDDLKSRVSEAEKAVKELEYRSIATPDDPGIGEELSAARQQLDAARKEFAASEAELANDVAGQQTDPSTTRTGSELSGADRNDRSEFREGMTNGAIAAIAYLAASVVNPSFVEPEPAWRNASASVPYEEPDLPDPQSRTFATASTRENRREQEGAEEHPLDGNAGPEPERSFAMGPMNLQQEYRTSIAEGLTLDEAANKAELVWGMDAGRLFQEYYSQQQSETTADEQSVSGPRQE